MAAILRVKQGWAVGTEFPLVNEANRIGRDRSCQIRMDAQSLSRSHAQIEPGKGGWVLTDLGSTNGTSVNGERVKSAVLKPGDEVRVGDVVLIFMSESASQALVEIPELVREALPKKRELPARRPERDAGPALDGRAVEQMKQAYRTIRKEVGRVIVGQDEVLNQILVAMLAQGHCLMVGVPGLAKTLMVRTIAQVLDLDFKRVQFTPDLMPSDITGTDVLEIDETTNEKKFRFIRGPVFTNLLLADEINRTPPKTQASLLEAMQERNVTASGYTYKLEEPFFVLATQNPLEQEGTYPLPEAQLDRFMFNILVDYPTEEEEETIVKRTTFRKLSQPDRILSGADIVRLQEIVRRVPVPDRVIRYATALVRASRPGPGEGALDFVNERVQCGAGPRACQYLILGAKARTVLDGRLEVTIDDVKACAVPVMRHRIFLNFNALSEGTSSTDVVRQLLKTVEPPSDSRPIARAAPRSGKIDAKDIELLKDIPAGEGIAPETVRKMKVVSTRIREEVQKVIVGQTGVLDEILMAMLARGHCLMVGVPGLAKTLMVSTIASVLDLNFKRVQFTPDLMPSDITGTDVLEEDEHTGEKIFRFIKGPIFTNILLADEINRTPPKTQAALLEAMQEYGVTASGKTYELQPPFFVLATQNPLEQEGTYPLPEAQLDRFMFNVWVDYPEESDEHIIVKETTRIRKHQSHKIIGGAEIVALQEIVRRLPVSDHVIKYATRLARATRPEGDDAPQFIKDWVYCGAGPRACQYLILGAKARAVLDGRVNVSCNDVRTTALPVMRHRIFTNFNADSEGITTAEIIRRLLEGVPEPGEKDYAVSGKRRTAKSKGRRKSAVSVSVEAKERQEKKPEAAKIGVSSKAAAKIEPPKSTVDKPSDGNMDAKTIQVDKITKKRGVGKRKT